MDAGAGKVSVLLSHHEYRSNHVREGDMPWPVGSFQVTPRESTGARRLIQAGID